MKQAETGKRKAAPERVYIKRFRPGERIMDICAQTGDACSDAMKGIMRKEEMETFKTGTFSSEWKKIPLTAKNDAFPQARRGFNRPEIPG